eukprot:11638551-Alexandrium_andersonii.AAC.1
MEDQQLGSLLRGLCVRQYPPGELCDERPPLPLSFGGLFAASIMLRVRYSHLDSGPAPSSKAFVARK